MERIVLWGAVKRTAMYFDWLYEKFEIVAIVSDKRQQNSYHGIDIIGRDRIKDYDFDRIVITLENSDIEAAIGKICAVDEAYRQKAVTLDQISHGTNDIESYFDYVSSRQLGVIDELLNATDEEITDFDWMLKRVRHYGIFCFQSDWMKMDNGISWAVYGLQQIPEEFAAFCNHISKLEVNSAIEVGVYRGRSAFFICAILAMKNRNLTYKMVDIYDRIDDFKLFKAKLPQLEKCIPSCSDDYKGQAFDFVFIDADHSYDASIRDFNNVGQYGKVVTAFHDIYAHEYDHENGGTVRMWQEVLDRTSDERHFVFSQYPDKWMGIGVVEWR